MRISKIIVALLVSVVAVTAMTGVVSADPSATVAPDSATVNIVTNAPTPFEVTYSIAYPYTGEDLPDGICVEVERDDCSPPVWNTSELSVSWDNGAVYHQTLWCNDSVPTSVVVGNVETWTWECLMKDATDSDDSGQMDHHYNAQFTIINGTMPTTVVTSQVTAGSDNTPIDPIPEFATIAIPAIAVLGLFLFFNKRKHKKE